MKYYFQKIMLHYLFGDTIKLNAIVLPQDASNKQCMWSSGDTNIAIVAEDGTITAKSEGNVDIVVKSLDGKIENKCSVTIKKISENQIIQFDNSLRVNGDEISKIDVNKNTVLDIKNLITTNLIIEIYNNKNDLLEENSNVGTGDKIVLKDSNNNEVYSYQMVIYGDVNGDGLINSLDVLVIQKHILETKLITSIFLKAGNISKNGSMPSALDVLKIQKHILETKFIEQ